MVYLITAPSGAGKNELVRQLGLPKITTFTTRQPRRGESDMYDYYFVDKPTFRLLENIGRFVETNTFKGEFYGTPKAGLQTLHDCCLIVDPNGSKKVGEYMQRAGIEYRRVWIETSDEQRRAFLENDDTRCPAELESRLDDGIKAQWDLLGLKADYVLPSAMHPLSGSVA